jgi:hypothetical protein
MLKIDAKYTANNNASSLGAREVQLETAFPTAALAKGLCRTLTRGSMYSTYLRQQTCTCVEQGCNGATSTEWQPNRINDGVNDLVSSLPRACFGVPALFFALEHVRFGLGYTHSMDHKAQFLHGESLSHFTFRVRHPTHAFGLTGAGSGGVGPAGCRCRCLAILIEDRAAISDFSVIYLDCLPLLRVSY